jgi:hypothetical protein
VGPTCSRPSESEAPPMQSADSDAPQAHTHDESSNRGGGVPNTSAQRAPSVSERGGGVFHEPEASAPGLPNQPRPEGSGSTFVKEPVTSNDLHAATSPTPQTPEPAPSGRG